MNLKRKPLTYRLLMVVMSILAFSTYALAQYTTGTVQGTVLDPSGAVVKGARITLRSLETNQSRTFKTSGDGVYLFAAVTPGHYDLTAEAAGFAKVVTSLAATSNDTITQNIKLAVASEGTTVRVEALAAAAFSEQCL